MRPVVVTAVLALCCLINVDGRQPGVQRFDRPALIARSPRNANYTIDVTLDHAARTLKGRETIQWRNISANASSELQFHLYWNAFRNLDSTWLRERQLSGNFTAPRRDAWGSTDVTRLRVRRCDQVRGCDDNSNWVDLSGQRRFIAPDDGNTADQTVMAVTLPWMVQPEETVEIEVEWTGKVPRPFSRTGYVDNYYFIAQWFPKLGVLEDAGWNTHQFHSATEFYSDYGVYDVRITVPDGFVVGSSGREVMRTDNGNGSVTHEYHGEDIHDVAWTASPDFVEVKRTFENSALPRVEMRLLLQPEHAGQESRHFAATEAALKYYGSWFGPYPYDYITIVDPAYQSGSGGMEYPTLITGGSRWLAPDRVAVPEEVVVHEAGHQFWYGIVGSNEFENAWMDEGLNTFSTARALEEAAFPNFRALRFFGGFIPWVVSDIQLTRATDMNRWPGYRENGEADIQSTPTFRYWPGTAGVITYNKTSLWLHTLERELGWPTLQSIMSTYFQRWKFRHPRPDDFFAVVNEVTGKDMTWFFDQTYRSSNTFDYGIQSFTSSKVRLPSTALGPGKPDTTSDEVYRTVVVVRRYGEATFPIDIEIAFKDGRRLVEHWDGVDRRAIFTYDHTAEARSVEIDPLRVLLLDVNFTNNSATLEPRAQQAATKWSLKWLVWFQNLLLTYGFFV
jgi:hypothetical protein